LKLSGHLIPAITILALFLQPHCTKRQQINKFQDPALALQQALEYKSNRKFRKAEETFTFVIFNFPGSNEAANAQFHLADCYLEAKNYDQAIMEFEFYLKNFPHGRYQEEATFKLALATFRSAPGPNQDQTAVLRAKELFYDFLEEYPASNFKSQVQQLLNEIDQRLAHNEFQAARLYFKAGEYVSALVYYEYIQQNWPELNWPFPDRYQLAICYINNGEKEKAKTILEQLLTSAAPAKIIQLAQRQLSRINSN